VELLFGLSQWRSAFQGTPTTKIKNSRNREFFWNYIFQLYRLSLPGSNKVQCGTCLKPGYLPFVIAMVGNNGIFASVSVDHFDGYRLIGRKFFEIHKVERVVFLYQVVICLIGKCKTKHPLFFKVSFVNTCKRFYKHYFNT